MAALGGALVLGAFPRLRRELKAPVALIFAAGLLILANSRPLEGFLFSLPLLISVAFPAGKRFKSQLEGNGEGRRAGNGPAGSRRGMDALLQLAGNRPCFGHSLSSEFRDVPHHQAILLSEAQPHSALPAIWRCAPFISSTSCRVRCSGRMRPITSRGVKASIYYGFFLWPFLLLLAPCILALARGELRIVLPRDGPGYRGAPGANLASAFALCRPDCRRHDSHAAIQPAIHEEPPGGLAIPLRCGVRGPW